MRVVRAADRPFIPASHEDANNPGVFKRVLATKDELLHGRPQMINWARLPAHSSFRPHYHEDMEETFVIISGTAQMEVDETSCQLGRGDAIVVSPREVHAMRNTGTDDVEYIVVGISSGRNGKTVVVSR
jgi:mannose-6-phosphate isomerase-like protein (cupin superfamily)